MHSAMLALLIAAVLPFAAAAQQQPSPTAVAPTEHSLFAVEIRTGPKWDSAKPPQEQAYFREHSANLRRLREAGSLVMGARYSDKGLIVLSAVSADAIKVMMEADPSFAAGTFSYAVHEFNVFYSGNVQARPRRQ